MNASGLRLAQADAEVLRTPMPGSISTTTAPTLNRANVRAKNSRLGGTISTVRMPRPMPTCSRPWARTSAFGLEFAKGQVAVADPAGAIAAVRLD